MNYRKATLLAASDLGESGTKTIDINVRDIISRITMVWKVTKVGAGMDAHPSQDISKIELVDGSDVLFSMNGGQCQALCIYDRRCPTMCYGNHNIASSEQSEYGIDFGRWLYDTQLALDPTRFRNPQLKITFSRIIANTDASVSTMEVFADVFDEKIISPIGFLMSKEHHSRTPPASGYWYIDMPTDHVIRKMLVQGYYKQNEAWNNVSEARLDEDNEKRIPFDWELEAYYRHMIGVWTPVSEKFVGSGSNDGDTFYVTPTDYWASGYFVVEGGAQAVGFFNTNMVGGYCVLTSVGVTKLLGRVSGYLPNHCFEFPFGYDKDLEDWYDVTKLGSLRLRLEAGTGAANGTVGVVLQQLRRY